MNEARSGHGYLWPCGDGDLSLAFVKESNGAVGNVEAERRWNSKTPFIPEASAYSNVGALAEIFNLFPNGHWIHIGLGQQIYCILLLRFMMKNLTFWLENKDILEQVLVCRVRSPFTWQDPRYTRFASCLDKGWFGLFRCMAAESDNQRVLASECFNNCLWLTIVDLPDRHAFWQLSLAIDSCDGGDSVPAGREESSSDEATTVTTSLC